MRQKAERPILRAIRECIAVIVRPRGTFNILHPALLLLAACCVTAPEAHAQVYKWVDDRGKTHYGDMPPGGAQAKPATVKVGPSPEASRQITSWEEKERDFRRRQIEQNVMNAREEIAPTSQQICASARKKLATLDGTLIYRVDKKGERVYMEDAERTAIEKQARQDIARHCRN